MFSFTRLRIGFTLVEVVVVVGLFGLIGVSMYQAYARILETNEVSRVKTVAANIANEKIEIARNVSYEDVGTIGGIPDGVFNQQETITRDGYTFDVRITIRNIDQEFDGTIGGTPNDTSPADNKMMQVDLDCTTCPDTIDDFSLVTNIGPLGLESLSTNGALMINVFDANGQDIAQADVTIINNSLTPSVSIDDVTGDNGILTIVDAPPSLESYEIIVTKDGYSTDQTYGVTAENTNPIKKHSTVTQGTVTQISFAIDEVSDMTINTVDPFCSPVANVDFSLEGSKLIGSGPDVLKYSQDHATNASGVATVQNLEWDTYTLDVTDSVYDFIGSSIQNPITVSPGTDLSANIIVLPESGNTLLVHVKDQGTGLPIDNASVRLNRTGYDVTKISSRINQDQTDWSGGSGQINFSNETQYSSQSGSIVTSSAGQLTLSQSGGVYSASGNLTSSIFDLGTTAQFHNLSWTGTEPSGTNIRFQISSGSTTGELGAFVGPDGTDATYYETSGSTFASLHDGHRYMQYRIYLSGDTTTTPTLNDISFDFSSSCTPNGQAFFQDLTSATHTLTVNATGYQESSQDIDPSSDWQELTIELTP